MPNILDSPTGAGPQNQRVLSAETAPRSLERLWSFAAVFAFLVSLHQIMGVTVFIHDSRGYWVYSSPASLFNYPNMIRGYLYPGLLMPLNFLSENYLGGSKVPFRLVSSLIYAWGLTSPTFDYFAKCFGSSSTLAKRTLFGLLPITIFPGLFIYPLSDLPGVLMMIAASLLAWRATGRYWWLFAVFAGIAAGAAYNTRTVYLFGVVALLVVWPTALMQGQSIARRLLAPILVVLGALLVSVPQMILNKHVHGQASPLVVATVGNKPLMAVQLYWGVGVQKYETSARKDEPKASRYYVDPVGLEFRKRVLGGELGDPGIGGYLRLVMRDPLLFAGIYARHFINGIDVRDGIVYTTAVSSERTSVSLLCFSILFFAGLVAVSRDDITWRQVAMISPLLIAVMAVVPGAVETRFFLPFYLIAFGLIVTKFEASSIIRIFKERPATIGLSYVILGAIFLGITTATMAGMQPDLP